MPGLFITATGTEVGKTFATAGLIGAARRAGHAVRALKPVVSGFDERDAGGSDPAILLAALDSPVTPETLAEIAPFRFRAPLSPDMAAAAEGRRLAASEVIAVCRAAFEPGVLTIIEGVGGIMVPLAPHVTVLDIMSALALPVVLVSPTGLGAISHLLTALDVLARRSLTPVSVVFSETPGSTVPLEATIATVSGFYPAARIFSLRRGLSAPEAAIAFDQLFAHIAPAVFSRDD